MDQSHTSGTDGAYLAYARDVSVALEAVGLFVGLPEFHRPAPGVQHIFFSSIDGADVKLWPHGLRVGWHSGYGWWAGDSEDGMGLAGYLPVAAAPTALADSVREVALEGVHQDVPGSLEQWHGPLPVVDLAS